MAPALFAVLVCAFVLAPLAIWVPGFEWLRNPAVPGAVLLGFVLVGWLRSLLGPPPESPRERFRRERAERRQGTLRRPRRRRA